MQRRSNPSSKILSSCDWKFLAPREPVRSRRHRANQVIEYRESCGRIGILIGYVPEYWPKAITSLCSTSDEHN
jgi:hypothetical protein